MVSTIPTAGWLAGIAFDNDETLYVVTVDYTPGVYRIEQDGSATRVLTLPPNTTPNGLAFYRGVMYVTDSEYGAVDANGFGAVGAVWKKGPNDTDAPTTPWLQDPLISPDPSIPWGNGANGIAFYVEKTIAF